jgi:hypothetical protein
MKNDTIKPLSFGKIDCDLEQLNIARIEKAESLGWTNIIFVYDDDHGGLYLGGVDPDGKWGSIP